MLYSRELPAVGGLYAQCEGVCQVNERHRPVSVTLTLQSSCELWSESIIVEFTTRSVCLCGQQGAVRSTYVSVPKEQLTELVGRIGREVGFALGLPESVEPLLGCFTGS